MKRKNTKTKQQGCDVAKMIDTIEKAASAAKKVYLVIEPVVNAFTNRRKTNKPHKRSPGRNEAGTFQI